MNDDCHEFYFFILDVKCTNSSIAKKNIHFTCFLRSNFKSNFAVVCFFFKKSFSPQKIFMSCLWLCHGTYLNGTSNVFVHLLLIFLGTMNFEILVESFEILVEWNHFLVRLKPMLLFYFLWLVLTTSTFPKAHIFRCTRNRVVLSTAKNPKRQIQR